MALQVYPFVPTSPKTYPAPLTVDQAMVVNGQVQPTISVQSFTELASSDTPPQMFIRVAIDSNTVTPTLQLAAGPDSTHLGTPVASNPYPQTATVSDSNGNYIASFTMQPEANGVYFFTVYLGVTGSVWMLTIVNSDTSNHIFTWVVADNDGDSKQPWLDITAALNFNALITDQVEKNLTIQNYGTGSLTGIAATFSGSNASDFTANLSATSVSPNSNSPTPVTVALNLNALSTPQPVTASMALGSNDPNTINPAPNATGPGHNSNVAITGNVGSLELAFMLDGSGSMQLDGVGQSPSGPGDSSRWSLLYSAATASLNSLKNFAPNKGRFAVGVYPDVITPNLSTPSAYDFQLPVAITDQNVSNAVAAIPKTLNVAGSTPMGYGLLEAIGNASVPGYFIENTTSINQDFRWVILMTDGNDNFDPPAPMDVINDPQYGCKPKKIQTIAIGYGNNAASGVVQPVNTALLQNVVNSGYNGLAQNYDFAQSDGSPSLVMGFIKQVLSNVLPLDNIMDPSGVLTTSNPTVTQQVIVGPYDRRVSFIVGWSTDNAERLDITVTTPLGEVLQQSIGTGCTVDIGDRYRMITVDKDFLDNARAGKPRYGIWTLTITLASIIIELRRAEEEDSEVYSYQIATDSRLNLRCSLDKVTYTAGDPVSLSARLSLNGLGITGAAVSVTQTTPGVGAINWLANNPVTASEYNAAAAAQASNPDMDSLGIKHVALQNKGVTFKPVINTATATLTDADHTGTYSITSSNTTVPGTYGFLVTAVGTLADGSLFRREQNVTIEVVVRADPAFTVVQVGYLPAAAGSIQATFTVWPRDRFSNVILIDPKIDSTVQFTTSGGSFAGPIVDNHDGSYTQSLTYPAASPPSVGIVVGGVTVVPTVPIEPVGDLHYVDKVYTFKAGTEAAPGANQHTDPTACLGDFTKKATPGFVSLGAGGSLVVGFSGHYAVDDHHGHGITVFVQPDQPLRPYSVEAHHGDKDDTWFEIGQSAGITQTFSLRHHHHLPTARAIRIRDRSGQLLNSDATPSASPGVSILAVGARHIERGDGDLDDLIRAWLRKLGHELFG